MIRVVHNLPGLYQSKLLSNAAFKKGQIISDMIGYSIREKKCYTSVQVNLPSK